MEYWSHLQIDRLERTEGPLHYCQALVGGHCRLGWQIRRRQTRTHYIQAIERGLLLDLHRLAFPAKARVGDAQLEVLGHLEVIDDPAHAQGNRLGALEPVAHARRSEERRVGKECRSRWSPYH